MGSSSSTAKTHEKTPIVLFHRLHGENIQISSNWRSVKRLQGFEHAICFSHKPIIRNRYIDIRIKETNPSWRGVLRFGVTTQHPGTLKREFLPQCACPGLQERDSFWIAPIPEIVGSKGNEVYFYVATDGNVMCGITANGKRLAFEEEVVTTGVPNNQELWMVMDLYGQTTELEIFEPSESLTVLQRKPTGQSSQKDSSAKLVNRGRENPFMENEINLAIQRQKETGEGSSQDPELNPNIPRNHPGPNTLQPGSSEGASTVSGDEPKVTTRGNETESSEPKEGDENHTIESAECTVCMDGTSDCALYKCGHICMCHKCANDVMQSPTPFCPVCREPIEDVIKTYQT